MTEWEPATEAEAAMRDALRANDQERYFRILARTELLLPVSADALAGRAPMGWGTWTTGGRTHVLAFTSSAALHACLAENAGSARRLPYQELAGGWPNLEWWLAVNPGLPIEGYLPAWFVSQLARGDVRLPGRTMAARARVERAETVARARATAAVPGRTVPPDAGQATPADTTPPDPPTSGRATATSRPWSAPGGSVPVAQTPTVSAPASTASVPTGAASVGGGLPPTAPSTLSTGAAAAGQVGGEPAAAPGRAGEEAAAGAVRPDITPANDVERSLLAAAGGGSTDSFLSTLLLAKVLLPVAPGSAAGCRPGDDGFIWRTETLDGETHVVVFTSFERLADYFAGPVETVGVRFARLIRHWPDDGWSFAVNPNTVIGAKLPGGQVVALANWAAEAGLGEDSEDAGPEEPPAAQESSPRPVDAPAAQDPIRPTMQKIVAPSQVDYYLNRGYDRVSGFVHRANEIAHLTTPAELIAALGLEYPGSPFSPDVDEVHVLRWPVYRPSLYRIPYGGQNEAAMRAMEGWVIERAPFRGNGFAPGESSDVIAEFKLDSARLPHGAQLWRIGADGTEKIVAILDSDAPAWQRIEEG